MSRGGLKSGQGMSVDAHIAYRSKTKLTIRTTLGIIKNVAVSSSQWLVSRMRVANTVFHGGRRGAFFAHVLDVVESVVMIPCSSYDGHSRDEKKEWS